MKIGLIDTRTAMPDASVGSLVSTHATMADAFKASDLFQKHCSRLHVVTKIAMLREEVIVGELVMPSHLAGEGEKA